MDISRAPTVSVPTSAMKKIGKYEVIKELGKGATSAVYQALSPRSR